MATDDKDKEMTLDLSLLHLQNKDKKSDDDDEHLTLTDSISSFTDEPKEMEISAVNPSSNQCTSRSHVSDLSNVSTRLTLVEDSIKDLTKKVRHNGSQLDEILNILHKDSGKKSAGREWDK
jgi:hypothetical protein